MTSQRRIRISPRQTIAVIIALVGVLLLNASWRTIAPGSVGIAFNRANNTITAYREPGWVLVNPFTTTVYDYPATIQTYVMVQNADEGPVAGDDSIKVQSRESQQLNLDAVSYTHLDVYKRQRSPSRFIPSKCMPATFMPNSKSAIAPKRLPVPAR